MDKDDVDVWSLIQAFKERCEKRCDQMEKAGLTEAQYEAAKKRITILTHQLPEQLHMDVLDELGRTK